MPTCDGVDDVVALVDRIDANPEILVDFNNSPLFYSDWEAPPPPNDGPIYLATSHGGRVISFNVNVEKQAIAAEVAEALQPAIQYISRGQVWLMFQKAGGEPVFFTIRPSSVTAIQEYFEIDTGSAKTISLALNAGPFAEGLEVTGSFTITNDPTTGANPMQVVFDDIQGDVLAPLYLKFPTADAIHKIKWASEAILRTAAPVFDSYNRDDSASTLGSADTGQAYTTYAGTWGIDENQGYIAAPVAAYAAAVVDSGLSDIIAEITLAAITPTSLNGLFIRGTSISNGFWFGGSNVVRITAGVATNLGAYSEVFMAGDQMRVRAVETTYTVYRQVAGVGPWTSVKTFTDAAHSTNTDHGPAVFGTDGDDARFENFSVRAAERAAPYYKSLATATKDASPATGWTITDTADAGTIGANRRRLVKSGGDAFIVPTSAAILPWDDIPAGNYRVFVRVSSIDVDTKVLFFNRPPRIGSVLTEDDAVTWTTAGSTPAASGHRDWLDLGVAAMPGGSPIADNMYDLDPIPDSALWNVGVSTESNTVLDLDAIMLIPAGRTGTITRHGGVAFTDDHVGKTAIIDGINSRRYAKGTSPVDPTSTVTALPALEMYAALPVVVPKCQNILTFLADVIYYDATRVNDSKALTTLIEFIYHPRYLNDRPDMT